jgi:hypothetical protein
VFVGKCCNLWLDLLLHAGSERLPVQNASDHAVSNRL